MDNDIKFSFIVDAFVTSWVGGIVQRKVIGVFDAEDVAAQCAVSLCKSTNQSPSKVRVVKVSNPYVVEGRTMYPPEVILQELVPRGGREPRRKSHEEASCDLT